MTKIDTEFLVVPTEDSTDDVAMRDVVGKKSDTVAGDSLIARIKQAIASFLVPTANSTANTTIADAIGNKNDLSFSDWTSDPPDPSVIGHLTANYYHVHDAARVYPRTDDDTPLAFLTVTGSATALTYGSWVEISGFDSKTVMADCHFVFIGTISANDDYVLQLGIGASGSQAFWGECAFTRDTNQQRTGYAPIQGKPIPAGTKLWARLASTGGGSNTVDIKVYTHQYPSVTGN